MNDYMYYPYTEVFMLTDKVIKLWEELGDISIDKDECIEQKFHSFEIGTERSEIWYWFEETFQISVAKDLMYRNC